MAVRTATFGRPGLPVVLHLPPRWSKFHDRWFCWICRCIRYKCVCRQLHNRQYCQSTVHLSIHQASLVVASLNPATAAPTITTVSPNTRVQGSAAATVTITGTGYRRSKCLQQRWCNRRYSNCNSYSDHPAGTVWSAAAPVRPTVTTPGGSANSAFTVAAAVAFSPHRRFLLLQHPGSGFCCSHRDDLDNLFHRLGLHGFAVIPVLLGFGCNCPKILPRAPLNPSAKGLSPRP